MNGFLRLVILTLSFGGVSAQAADMSALDEWLIKSQIKELVDQYAMARDNIDAVAYANTFTANGSLIINGQPYTGREVIQARVESADQNAIGMHIMSTSQITVIDESNATGIHYATVYGATPDDSYEQGSTIEIAVPVTQGKYYDVYSLTDEGWKLAERRFERVYTFTP